MALSTIMGSSYACLDAVRNLGMLERKRVQIFYRTLENSAEAMFVRAPILGCKISRVVAPLGVATPCYTKVQQKVPSRRVSTPEGLQHAALECSRPRPMVRLLP